MLHANLVTPVGGRIPTPTNSTDAATAVGPTQTMHYALTVEAPPVLKGQPLNSLFTWNGSSRHASKVIGWWAMLCQALSMRP